MRAATAGPRGSGEVTVTWEPPRHDGGEKVTHYQIERNGVAGPQSGVSEGRSRTFSVSIGGETQTFKIRARNKIGRASCRERGEMSGGGGGVRGEFMQ